MELQNSFVVPTDIDTAWKSMQDVEGLAPCMPGATLESHDGDEFTGNVKVKLGPVSMVFGGWAKFVSRDEATHTAVIEGSGKEAKGTGTAKGMVTATLVAEAPDRTRVDVNTDLTITGKAAQFGALPQRITVLDVLGALVWLVGFYFEAAGDAQLERFKADPANKGKIMDRGLWSWTRHPNYFGDVCVWVGLWLLALGHPAGLITVVSPLVMGFFLVKVSGKALLEKNMRRSRGPAYDAYVARTSGFFPRPPRRG